MAADFGDAPAPYPTLLAANGPQHAELGTGALQLGESISYEADGQPSADAIADSGDDGVVFGEVRVGQLDAEVEVTVSNAPAGAKLDGWIDFNGDGSWGGADERVFAGVSVVEGVNTLTFDVPSGAHSGETYARFRLSTAGGLGVKGLAADGEVEDYAVTIAPPPERTAAFAKQVIVTDPNNIEEFSTADLDGDGDMDLIVSAFDGGGPVPRYTLAWYRNNGDEVFSRRLIANMSEAVGNIEAADVDGDGDTDLLVVYRRYPNAGQVSWYENNGQEGFTEHSVSGASYTFDAKLDDMDGDGDLDILIGSYAGNIAWFENDGNRGFAYKTHIVSPDLNVTSVDLADMDQDGDLDIIAGTFYGSVIWYEQVGPLHYEQHSIAKIQGRTPIPHTADMDGDGDLDILLDDDSWDGVHWYENDGLGSFQQVIVSPPEGNQNSQVAADFDGDGDIDIVASNIGGVVVWYERQSDGSYLRRNVGAAYGFVQAADLDSDGDIDIVATERWYNGKNIVWFENKPAVHIDRSDASATEESEQSVTFNFFFDAPFADSVDLSFRVDGTARLGDDYKLTGFDTFDGVHGTILLPAGQTSAQLVATLIDDTSAEINESISITLLPTAEYLPSELGNAVTWIVNDESGADFGDAPAPYPTLLDDNGPRHSNIGPDELRLGVGASAEADGGPSQNADADQADEGIVFGDIYVGQSGATIQVFVANAPNGARLDGWIDFDADGSWGGPREKIFASTPVSEGVNALTFDVPGWAAPGLTHVRFRLSSVGGLAVTGYAEDGEVEDYAVTIAPPASSSTSFMPSILVGEFDRYTPPKNVTAVDIDGDGDLDAVVRGSNSKSVVLFMNDGEGGYDRRLVYSTPYGANFVTTADIDSDGDTDIIVASEATSSRLLILENQGEATFVPVVIATNRLSPTGMVAADVDGDSDLDLVIASSATDRIVWYENEEDNNFTLRTITTLADGASSVHVVDLDGDGDLDVLSTSTVDDTVAWYENDGAQNFTRWVITTSADDARVVLTADIDLDGDLDVVSASSGDSTIAWYENDGAQSFTKRVISTAVESPVTLIVADVDGDGWMDMVSGSGGVTTSSGSVVYFHNQGDGSFEERLMAPNVGSVSSIQAADFDKDGDLDILAAMSSDRKVVWIEHVYTASLDSTTGDWLEGSGDWTVAFSIPEPMDQPMELAFSVGGEGVFGVDFELTGAASFDGSRGIVVIPAGETSARIRLTATEDYRYEFDELVKVSLLRGPGEIAEPLSSFTKAIRSTDYGASFGDAPSSYPTTLVDDGARHTDVGDGSLRLGVLAFGAPDGTPSTTASSDPSDDGVVFSPMRVGQLGAEVTVTVSNAPAGAMLDAWIDFNGDGNWSGGGERVFTSVPVVEGENLLTFDVPVEIVSGVATFARFRLSTAGDLGPTGLADDGEVEDYALTVSPAVRTVGSFGDPEQILPGSEIRSDTFFLPASKMTPADLDGDGDLDLLTQHAASGGLTWYENEGGSFGGPQEIGSEGGYTVSPADIDRDGDLDIVTVDSQGLAWYENLGSAAFGSRTEIEDYEDYYVPGNTPINLAVVDDDGDGWLDIAWVAGSNLLLSRSDGSGGFDEAVTLASPGDRVVDIQAADLNGDGLLDFVVARDATGRGLRALQNNGDGTFTTTILFTSATLAASPIDMDGDGDLDLVVQTQAEIAWLRNDGEWRFTEQVIGGATGNPNGFAVADFDGDGDFDVVEASRQYSSSPRSFTLFNNDGTQRFDAIPIEETPPEYTSVFAADMDGDGAIDLVSVNDSTGVSLFRQALRATISSSSTTVLPEDGGSHVVRLEFGADAVTDVAVPFVISGEATLGVDYTISGADSVNGSSGVATIAAGTRWVDLTITTVADSTPELFESIEIALSEAPADRLVRWIAADSNAGDYGDAPSTYPVTSPQAGAAHLAVGPRLGATRTTEPQGAPTPNAEGDAGDDGAFFGSVVVGSANAQLSVDVQNAPAGAYVDVWIDLDADGLWSGKREQVLTSVPVVEGVNLLEFETPSWASVGSTFARVRLSSTGGLTVTGNAADGEVEDYEVMISSPEGGTVDFSQSNIGPEGEAILVVEPVDFDRDGRVDVVAVTSSGSLYWQRNEGAGAFATQLLASVGPYVQDLAIDDLDGDGDYDIVVASKPSSSGGDLVLLRNDRVDGFVATVVATNVQNVNSVSVVDINGDGAKDLLSGGHRGGSFSVSAEAGSIVWYESDRAGGFIARHVAEGLGAVVDVDAADLDGDGDLDLYASAGTVGAVLLFRNDGEERFTSEVVADAYLPAPFIRAGGRVRAMDFDGDGDLDLLASPSLYDQRVVWHENDGAGRFVAQTIVQLPGYARGAIATDLDADGDLDLVLALSDNAPATMPGWIETRVAGDVNDDGVVDQADADFWRANYGATSGPGLVADITGDGFVNAADYTAWRDAYERGGEPSRVYLPRSADWSIHAVSLAAADLDGDLALDLVAATSTGVVVARTSQAPPPATLSRVEPSGETETLPSRFAPLTPHHAEPSAMGTRPSRARFSPPVREPDTKLALNPNRLVNWGVAIDDDLQPVDEAFALADDEVEANAEESDLPLLEEVALTHLGM